MAELNINLNIETFMANVLSAIVAKFSDDFAQITFYPLRSDMLEAQFKDVGLPAILLDLSEFEPTPSDGLLTEQLSVNLRMTAYIVYATNYPRVQSALRTKTAEIAQFIHFNQKFNSPVNPAIIERIEPEYDVNEQSSRFHCWAIEWYHEAVLEKSTFDVPLFKPTEMKVSIFPSNSVRTGLNFITEYVEIPLK